MLIFFILIISMNTLSSFSSENIGNLSHSIQKSYGPSEYIKGWINISLEDEPANSLFEANGYSISLINLLNLNPGFIKSCSSENCETDYLTSNPEIMKNFNLKENNYTLFGFEFTGNIISVNSINFEVESDVGSSCYNQLEIDLFNDGKIDIINNKVLDAPECGDVLKKYGCFNEDKPIEEYSISEIPYCQKIKPTKSPGFKIGAWLKEVIVGDKKLTMELYDNYGHSIKNCKLSKEEIPETGGEIFCNINYSVVESKDYYVCIYSDNGDGEYRIRGNSNPLTGCGFYGIPIPFETPGAYQIFAEGKRFGAIETLEILDLLPNGDNLGSKIYEYIVDTYGISGGNIDCSSGCVVPIKLISKKDQNSIIKNLEIKYDKTIGEVTDNKFYDLSKTTSTINAAFQKLYLDGGNFSVPDDFGDYTFSLSLNDEQIFSEELIVGKVPIIKNLKPRTTASAYPTKFEVTVESEGSIIKYDWNFGNNKTKTTTTNNITYTYNSTGKYKLTITVTDSSQSSSSKEFEIDVGSPKIIINSLLGKMLTNLNNLKAQINEFDSFYQDSLKSILDLEFFESELEKIQTSNASATSESEYNSILTDLLKLEIPESVSTSVSADSVSFYPKEGNINLNILKIISGGDYDVSNENKYIEAIFGWNQKNLETKINFKELSAKYEYSEEPILKIFELKINENPSRENSYLIIPKLDNIKFKEDYSEGEKEEYFYISLTGSQTTITFSTTEDINFIDLPVFISPAISDLSITEEPDEKNEKLSKMALFILIVFLLAIIGVVIYIILQEWYKRKYEAYLFKNRNELYNLISYIQSSKKKGLEDKEIIVKLKKAGWKFEQITYVIRKYSGKRTGMLEIPVGKILGKFKKEKVKNITPGKLRGNFPRSKTFSPRFNPKRTGKRFS